MQFQPSLPHGNVGPVLSILKFLKRKWKSGFEGEISQFLKYTVQTRRSTGWLWLKDQQLATSNEVQSHYFTNETTEVEWTARCYTAGWWYSWESTCNTYFFHFFLQITLDYKLP